MGGDNFKPNAYSRGMYGYLWPGFENIFNQWKSQTGMSNYGMPNSPYMPSMYGVLSGVNPYSLYGYDIPDTASLMPTTEWWNSLSSDVKAGAWAPFEEGKENMMETLGGSGMGGSARGGYSGAAGAALGEYMADATPKYSMNLWNMSQPGMMAGWQAQLGENQYMAGLQNQRSQQMWQNQLTERQTDYSNEMNRLNQDYSGQMQAWQLPWQMAMNYNNLAPSGAYHSDGGGTMSSAMGGLSSILGPVGMGYGMGAGAGKGGGAAKTGSSIMPYANSYTGGGW